MAGTGGARPGAGRKSKATKLLEAGFCAPFFDQNEQARQWKSMLAHEDAKIRLDACKYLTDRLYGKAAQALDLNHSGELELVKRVVSDL